MMIYIPLFAPIALTLVTADRFAALPPLPWGVNCYTVGRAATPQLVCEEPLIRPSRSN